MSFELKYSELVGGRGIFATRDISVDSTIFEEDPLVSCQLSWNAAYKYLACDHCLRPMETAQENVSRLLGHEIELMYPECCITNKSTYTSCQECGVQYCSPECQSNAHNQYHQILCTRTTDANDPHPLRNLNEAWKQMHYPPETSSIILIVRLLARILQAPNREIAIAQTLEFCHHTVNEEKALAHQLLGEKFADQISLLHSLLVAAVPNKGIEQFLTFEGFQSLLALIGTNGQGIGTSAFAQWVKNADEKYTMENNKQLDDFVSCLYDELDETVGQFLNVEGVGLYPLQSACNHSCNPNAEARFDHNNHRLSLVAIENIKEGDEIFISYLDMCDLGKSRRARREVLMSNYIFECKCKRCEMQEGQQESDSDCSMDDSD